MFFEVLSSFIFYARVIKPVLTIESFGFVFSKLKEARNSFFGLGVYLLKSKFRIEGKLRFP